MDIGMLIRRICAKCHPAAYLFVPVIRLKDRLEGGRMHRSLEENLEIYCSEAQKHDPAALRRLKRDMWYSFILYHASFSEYFVYRFPRLSHEGRREFVTEAEKNALCEKLSPPEVWRVIWDKWSAYTLFRDFYRRDAIKVDAESDLAEFEAFIGAHPRFIAKPRLESCGMGVTIYDAAAPDFDMAAVFAALQGIGVICEELIVETGALAALHPSSVNTVRIATLMKDGEPVVLFTFLRVGRGDSIVDNGGAGGFVALIDTETGIVTTPGVTERLLEAVIHPDTGLPILGIQIPRWPEALDLARKAAAVYPDHPYISWDLAYTENGWIIVEANCMGQFIGPQFTTGRGCRAYLSRYFDL
ncbi:MAG: sugar-transfer associated ATP-grasp domain-containing protein [Oscillospiraceae bacterium]